LYQVFGHDELLKNTDWFMLFNMKKSILSRRDITIRGN
jgi:hypothetical protein